jgi:Sulfatase
MSQIISFVRVGSYQREARRRFGVLVGVAFTLSVTKLVVVGPSRGAELWLGTAFDAAVWVLLWLLSEAVAQARVRWAERAADALFYPALYLSGALVFAHTWFYDAAIERRLTVFDVTLSGIVHFFRGALPPRGYLALALVLLGAHLVAYLVAQNLRRPRPSRAAAVCLPLIVFALIGSLRAARTPSVLFDTGAELWQLATLTRVKPAPFAAAGSLRAALDRSATVPQALSTPFTKIVVLVMETMTARAFQEEGARLADSGFLHAGRAHAHRYSRYFPNNQDSRTGMLDMLSSRLIPYEAYGADDVAAYAELADQPSLLDALRRFGYRSAFAVSQEALEEVVSDLRWDERLHLDEAEIARARKGLLCLQPDEYENGCEDLALLPEIVEFLRKNDEAFVYQEFVWGHAHEYNEASGKSNASYYASYVDWLMRALSELGLLDQTLIVLTSDHGFRDKSKQAEPWVYRIPLWFYATRFAPRADDRLFSHVDFKDLLFAELSGTEPARESPLVMIVGPSGSGMLAGFEPDGSFTLLRRRGALNLLLARQPAGPGSRQPGELLHVFTQYKHYFDAQLAR